MAHVIFLLFGNFAYLLDCLSFSMRDMLKLRLIAIASSLSGMVYFFYHSLWLNVTANGICTIINIVQVGILLYQKRELTFDNVLEERLYHKVFFDLSPHQFKKLIQSATFETVEPGALLFEEGKHPSFLAIVAEGVISIISGEKEVAYCKENDFLGEMSFITERPAAATAKAVESTSFFQWKRNELKVFLEKEPAIKGVLNDQIGRNLIIKIN